MSGSGLKAYFWTNVLKRYSTGVVLVLAESADAAWMRLKTEDPAAWVGLRSGASYVSLDETWDEPDPDKALAEVLEERSDQSYEIPQPREYALSELPVIVEWGGE